MFTCVHCHKKAFPMVDYCWGLAFEATCEVCHKFTNTTDCHCKPVRGPSPAQKESPMESTYKGDAAVESIKDLVGELHTAQARVVELKAQIATVKKTLSGALRAPKSGNGKAARKAAPGRAVGGRRGLPKTPTEAAKEE